MATDPIHVGDRGTIIIITFKNLDINGQPLNLDLSRASLIRITFINPAGIFRGPFDMTILNNGLDGKAYYITDRTFSLWDIKGTWQWFGEIIAGDFLFRSDSASHPVIV